MNPFDRLHPALQHHIVNSLGWSALRPLQEAAIPPLMAGHHALLIAPTASGKTESAFFPVLSRMLAEGWRGLSVLYICPIKALLNNLEVRLSSNCALVGRRCETWHGDVKAHARKRILAEPPDCLLTTPESLEVILVSRRDHAAALFSQLQVVIVDEIHAFAGDDRGWHLLAVLERVARLAGREPQRVGLSATVGNPEALLEWLAGASERRKQVINPPASPAPAPEVQLDYVRSLENAALVISKLHRGEKRLVFCDSRARVEQLAAMLREYGVETYLSHSSLGLDERQRAEAAFASGTDCVIVATSTLELGIDVGTLDRIVQIDSPATVSSFLQRLGRSGRREGTSRNCLFLATTQGALHQAAGLLELWGSGFVEPIAPPAVPYHIAAQQMMALALQEGGIGRASLHDWTGSWLRRAGISEAEAAEILGFMLSSGILWEDEGILWLGRQGEHRFGRRNFLELFSVFTSPPLFEVHHGTQMLGQVDPLSFAGRREGPAILLLAGRSWSVKHIEWSRHVAYVEPTDEPGISRWQGDPRGLSFRLCRKMRSVLASAEERPHWSRRAKEEIATLREDFGWLDERSTFLVREPSGSFVWWTFAGLRANASLGGCLGPRLGTSTSHDNLSVRLGEGPDVQQFLAAVASLSAQKEMLVPPALLADVVEGLKFSECLPNAMATEMLGRRFADPVAVGIVLEEPVRPLGEAERASRPSR